MRKYQFVGAVFAVACAQLFTVSSLLAAGKAVVCDSPENGIISDKDTHPLKGPFLVSSLQNLVDPAKPVKSFVVWTPHSVWFDVDQFKGPFFIEDGQSLYANPDTWTKRGVAYSGYRNCH